MIQLRCTKSGFDHLDAAEDVHFAPAETDLYGYLSDSASWPSYRYEIFHNPAGRDPDRIRGRLGDEVRLELTKDQVRELSRRETEVVSDGSQCKRRALLEPY